MGEHLTDGCSIIQNAEGDCLEVKVRVGGVDVGCLIDTGAEVSTITESFYKEFLAHGREVIDVKSYISFPGTGNPFRRLCETPVNCYFPYV